jgi:hypothetical protein
VFQKHRTPVTAAILFFEIVPHTAEKKIHWVRCPLITQGKSEQVFTTSAKKTCEGKHSSNGVGIYGPQ